MKLHLTGEPIALKKYKDFLNGKNKHLPDDFLTKSRVLNAIEQAKKLKDTPKTVDNIYMLLEKFFS